MKGSVTLPSSFLKLSPSLLLSSYAPPYLPPHPPPSQKPDIEKGPPHPAGATFDEAIALTGQGTRCQWVIVIASGLCILSCICETVGVAYFLPYVRCDLQITPMEKSLLGGAASSGMMTASLAWGLAADSWGRRPILLISLLLDVVAGFLSSVSPLYILLFLRFLCGVCSSGPAAVAYAFVGEYHGESSRAKAVCISGIFVAVAVIVLPAAAWVILPIELDLPLPWGVNFSSWRLYLVLTALPSLVTALIIAMLDETPRFQMSCGKEQEAMKTLSTLFSRNTGIPKREYPVKRLRTGGLDKSAETLRKGPFSAVLNIFDQMSPLFKAPYLRPLALCCFLQAGSFLCANGLLIWLPDIFGRTSSSELSSFPICDAMELSPLPDLLHQGDDHFMEGKEAYVCDISSVDTTAFANALIIGGTIGIAYIITAIISGFVNKRLLLGCLSLGASVFGFTLAPSRPSWVTLAVTSVFHALSGVSITVLGGLVADLFPTHLRAASLSISLTFGRLGMVGGATIIGILLEENCESAFYITGAVALAVALLSLLLPKAKRT